MLTLADASNYFDRTPILDAYTGATLFYGQVDLYDDAKRDSATAYRRVLSVKPGTLIPATRALKIHGSVWIVGASEIDGLSVAHRQKYVLHPAPSKLGVVSLSGFVSAAAATEHWADMVWFKDGKEDAVSSRVVPMYTAYLAQSVSLPEYSVITQGAAAYLVETPHGQASGIQSATCVRLEYTPVSATLATRTYDPVQGKYTASNDTTVKCLRVRWQSLFLYGSQGDAKYQEGDCSLVFPTGTVMATKDKITLAGQVWSILAVENLGGAVVAHGRLG